WAQKNDPRVTKIGKIFRKLRIDEIPQLFNVLNGDMSLVGPRPEREIFINDFKKVIPFYSLRLAVQPGLTGWAQVQYPYAASLKETEDKFRCDMYYVKNMSLMLDFYTLFKTVWIVLYGRGH
ncbi:MAG: sugar transferase, partial [Chlamydiota bacterium]|nr:sugar transferase [Chlamydiota bacterium]